MNVSFLAHYRLLCFAVIGDSTFAPPNDTTPVYAAIVAVYRALILPIILSYGDRE
jgi:hypothetical protein